MAKFLFISCLFVVLGFCQAKVCDLKNEIPHTQAINAKLCEPGAHPDVVAKQFFDCYDESITPGGTKFVECQKSVYGVLMDTEANLDVVCSAPKTKFPMYATCLMTKLVASGYRPSNTMHKLNQCQGGVMGVPPPK